MESRQQHRGKNPDEMRERAERMVLDHESEYGYQWFAREFQEALECVNIRVTTKEFTPGN